MTTAAYSYQNRISGNLRNSGIFFIVAGSISFIINLLSLWFYIGWFGLFREILGIIALILLIIAIGSMNILLPQEKDEIESSRRWLLIWVVLGFAWSFGYLIHPLVSVSLLVLSVIARIFALIKLNIVFQTLGDNFQRQERFDSWIFPLYGFFGIVAIVPSIFASLALGEYYTLPSITLTIVGIGISSINLLILIGVGIILIQNSQKILRITLTAIPGVPYAPPIHHKPISTQSGPVKEVQQPEKRFCENCGAKVNLDERFCQNCGHSLR